MAPGSARRSSTSDSPAPTTSRVPSPSRRVCRRRGESSSQGAEFITLAEDSATLIADYHDVPDTGLRTARNGQRRKYAKSGLCERRLQGYMAELDRLMQHEQVYLDPGLTLPALAERVGCSVNHLSQVLNAGFGLGFFDYVNRYRVQRAKSLLDAMDDSAAVLEIAYEDASAAPIAIAKVFLVSVMMQVSY